MGDAVSLRQVAGRAEPRLPAALRKCTPAPSAVVAETTPVGVEWVEAAAARV